MYTISEVIYMGTIGENIKQLRIDNNMTQEQLAKALDTTKSTISKYELDKRQPRYETVERMAAIFRTSTGRILNKGGKLKYMVTQWKSRKDAHLDIKIDAELLDTIQCIATHDGLSLEDEIEKMLLEYAEIIVENYESNNPENYL